jgi:RNA polymerase sigma-70 factor, ECF subfamily
MGREGTQADLDALSLDALGPLCDQASAAWPAVSVPRDDFLTYLAERIPRDRSVDEVAPTLRAADLYLACACARGDARALEAFDQTYGAEIARAFARVRPAGIGPDDAQQILRQKLFVASPERPARILDYAGRGDLRAWTRMTAVRTLIDLARERGDQRGEVPLDEVLFTVALPAERAAPDLVLLRNQYRAEFRASFEEAVAALTPRQRNLLRQHLLHDLNIDQLGALYRVHRSTCARWLAAARDDLVRCARRGLAARLGVTADELDDIMQLVASQLDITFQRVLATRTGDAP